MRKVCSPFGMVGRLTSSLQLSVSFASLHTTIRCYDRKAEEEERQRNQMYMSPEGSLPNVAFPIVQLPARSLWMQQGPLDVELLKKGEYESLIESVVQARKYYQYPSMSAPQVGWNVQMFTLFDDSIWINPTILETNCAPEKEEGVTEVGDGAVDGETSEKGKNCWAWEPCASCAFLMHYIERPGTCRIRAYNRQGQLVECVLERMKARFALHEMDHLEGILFTRRIPDTNHVVLLDGFSTMSDWSDDYPSLEARSTFLYTTFTPPLHFQSDCVVDANLLDRKFEDCIYPGHELDRMMHINNVANDEVKRLQWKLLKEKLHGEPESSSATAEALPQDDVDGNAK